MVKIFIVRHGHSKGNEQNLVTGHFNCALSETGIKQAQLVGDYIVSNVKVDKFYSSDLIRAVDTLKPASDVLNIPIISESAFREMHAGIWEGMAFPEIDRLYPNEFQAWTNMENYPSPQGGETWESMLKRVTKRLNEIVKENDNKTIVISTHGGVIRALQCYFLGIDLSEIRDLEWVPNASISEVWYNDGKYQIKKIGFDQYLGELTTQLPKTVYK